MTEGSGSVLGANTIRGHDVYFDISERSRIGFAPSECDYIKLSTGQSDDDNEEVETNKMEITNDDGEENNNSEGGDDDDGEYYEDDEEDMDDEFSLEIDDDKTLTNDGGDDYYEDDEVVKSSNLPDDKKPDNGTSYPFEFDTTRKSLTFVIVASMIVVAVAVVIYKRMKGGPRYITTELESDHLNDLHLDTEIERLPAIAWVVRNLHFTSFESNDK